MKKILLLILLAGNIRPWDPEKTVIGTVVLGCAGVIGYIWGNSSAEGSAQDHARAEIHQMKHDFLTYNYNYARELRIFDEHGSCNTEKALQALIQHVVTRNASVDSYIHELKQNQQQIAHLLEKAQTNESLWKDQEHYERYAQQAAALQPELISLKSKLDTWSKTVQREESALQLQQLVNTYKMRYAQLEKINEIYGRTAYENQVADFLSKLAPGTLFSLIAGIEHLKNDIQKLDHKLNAAHQDKNFNRYLVHREIDDQALTVKKILKYAYDAIAASKILQVQKAEARENELREREVKMREQQVANQRMQVENERMREKARVQEAENNMLALKAHNTQLTLEIMGHSKLIDDNKQLNAENKHLEQKIETVEKRVDRVKHSLDYPSINITNDPDVYLYHQQLKVLVSDIKEALKKK